MYFERTAEWNLRCTALTSFVFYEILKTVSGIKPSSFVFCDRAVIRCECRRMGLCNILLSCINAKDSLYIVIHSPRGCPTFRRHPHPPPVTHPNPASAHFLILARFRNKYLHYDYCYTQTTILAVYTIRDQNNSIKIALHSVISITILKLRGRSNSTVA